MYLVGHLAEMRNKCVKTVLVRVLNKVWRSTMLVTTELMKALKGKLSAQHDNFVSLYSCFYGDDANILEVVTVDKGRVLLVVGYHYLVI